MDGILIVIGCLLLLGVALLLVGVMRLQSRDQLKAEQRSHELERVEQIMRGLEKELREDVDRVRQRVEAVSRP